MTTIELAHPSTDPVAVPVRWDRQRGPSCLACRPGPCFCSSTRPAMATSSTRSSAGSWAAGRRSTWAWPSSSRCSPTWSGRSPRAWRTLPPGPPGCCFPSERWSTACSRGCSASAPSRARRPRPGPTGPRPSRWRRAGRGLLHAHADLPPVRVRRHPRPGWRHHRCRHRPSSHTGHQPYGRRSSRRVGAAHHRARSTFQPRSAWRASSSPSSSAGARSSQRPLGDIAVATASATNVAAPKPTVSLSATGHPPPWRP